MNAAEFNREMAKDLAKYRHDPLGYVLYAFPWGVPRTELAESTGPRQWQREMLAEVGEKLKNGASIAEVIQEAVVSGHGVGKSALIAWIVLWALSTLEDTKIVGTANTEKQLLTKTSPELAKWHRLAINSHWFKFTTTALYSADPGHEKTWRCDLVSWSENNTEAFAGLHNQGKRIILFFDEASAIADKVWEVAEGALTDKDTEILWFAFGNGTRATGRFRECFRKLRHRWRGRHIDSRTVEGTNKVQLDKWVEDYGEDSDFVKVRVRGMFPAMSAAQFISEVDVDAAMGRHLRPEQYNFAPKILTCDPAWTGDDELVIGLRQGLLFRILRTLPRNDNDVQVANILARIEDEEQADAVFIDGGYGTGIISAGQAMGRTWQLVWFSEKPYDQGCVNKRAEMWLAVRDWLKSGGAIPDDPRLREDLIGPEIKPRLDNKLLLQSKEDMKANGLPSPGRADALALTFAHPVASKAQGFRSPKRAQTEWDPFAEPVPVGRAVTEWNPFA